MVEVCVSEVKKTEFSEVFLSLFNFQRIGYIIYHFEHEYHTHTQIRMHEYIYVYMWIS